MEIKIPIQTGNRFQQSGYLLFQWLYIYHVHEQSELIHYKAKASETKIVDDAELEAAKKVMGEKKFQQEFECDWIANIEGSVYGDIIAKMEDKKQLTRVPFDPALPVSTAWDLGVSDHSAIIFFQQFGNSINIIDYYEEKGEGLPHYIQVIQSKDYIYKDHYAPHDIEVTDFSNGKTRREVAYQLGVNFKVVPKISFEDGIHATTYIRQEYYTDDSYYAF